MSKRAYSSRLVGGLLALVMMVGLLPSLIPTQKAEAAYHQSYIQTTIDTANWQILASCIEYNSGSIPLITHDDAIEYQRIGGALADLAGSTTPATSASYIDNTAPTSGGSARTNLVLTFPGNTWSAGNGIARTSATSADIARTQLVCNALIYGLNDAFVWVYGTNGRYMPAGTTTEERVENYRADMKEFLGCLTGSGSNTHNIGTGNCTISFYNANGMATTFQSELTKRSFPDTVTWYNDFVRISKNGETRYYQYRIPKGYRLLPSGDPRPTASSITLETNLTLSLSDDAQFVHWGHLAVEAFINYSLEDDALRITEDNVTDGDVGALEGAVASLCSNLADALTNFLGLWSFDELIFNGGLRGGSAYADGLFPRSWQSVIWAFFFISEIIALFILIYAIIINVVKKLTATVNASARASAMEQLQYLIICVIMLGLLPVGIQVLTNLSYNLTGIFSDILGDQSARERFSSLASSSGGLGSALIYLVYLGALIYFNIFYLVRSVMAAFLILVAPIFVAMMGVSVNRRQMVVAWAKEFLATVFIQPIQALMMSFLLLLPIANTRRIEILVLVYAMIPLTNAAKKLFLGDSGGIMDAISSKGQKQAGNMASIAGGVAIGAVGGAVSGASTAIKSHSGNSSGGESSRQSGSSQSESNATVSEPSVSGRTTNTGSSSTGASNGSTATGSTTGSGSTSGGAAGGTVNPVSSRGEPGLSPGTNTADTATSMALREAASGSKFESALETGLAAVPAAALGAIGGGLDAFNRRVFHTTAGPHGGLVTQLSQKAATGKVFKERPAAEAQPEGQATGMTNYEENPFSSETFGASVNEAAYQAAKEQEPNDNPYVNGMAERTPVNNGYQFTMDKDAMADAGIKKISHPESGSSTVSYNPAKCAPADRARLNNLTASWNNGTPEMQAAMQSAGIKEVTVSDRGGQVTGVNVTYDDNAAQQSFGLSAAGESGITSTVSSETCPQFVPDVQSIIDTAPQTVSVQTAESSAPVAEPAPMNIYESEQEVFTGPDPMPVSEAQTFSAPTGGSPVRNAPTQKTTSQTKKPKQTSSRPSQKKAPKKK